MKRHMLSIWIVVLVFLGNSTQTAAQSVRTASPPIIKIELSGQEPRSADTPAQLGYGAGGAGGGNKVGEPSTLFWRRLPRDLEVPSDAVACGYRSSTPPTAQLTFPSGRTAFAVLAPTPGFGDEDRNCWEYTSSWQYGMELGMYTLTLQHAEGTLTTTWGIDYPYCRKHITVERSERARKDFLVGFAPNQTLTLWFYAPHPVDPNDLGKFDPFESVGSIAVVYDFLAARTVTTDGEGALFLEMTIARNSPYSFLPLPDAGDSDRRLMYVVLNAGGEMLYYDLKNDLSFGLFTERTPHNVGKNHPRVPPLNVAPPKYTTYRTIVTDAAGTPMAIGIPSFLACSWDWTPVGQAWEYVQTAPSTGSNLPLYLEPGNTEQIVTELESGVPAQVLESSSALVNGRVEMWTKLRSEDGREGWARGKSFMPIVTERISGSRAVPAEVESYDTAAGKMALIPVQMYRQPDESSDSPGLLPFRAEVVILRCQDQWCLIRTADSQMGWVQEWKLVGLPWAPVEL